MSSLTIEYPPEVLWALQQEPEEFESEARLLLKEAIPGFEASGKPIEMSGVTLFFRSRSFIRSLASSRPIECLPATRGEPNSG